MPAISPARLANEVAQLFTGLEQPEAFLRGLEKLFESYADRTIRPAQSGMPASLTPAYHVPRPVMRAVEAGLAEYAARAPAAGLDLAERLWATAWLENRRLGLHLCAIVPDGSAPQALSLLMKWAEEVRDEVLLREIIRISAEKDPHAIFDWIGALLERRSRQHLDMALQGLISLAGAAGADESLPAIFDLLGRALEEPGSSTLPNMLVLIRQLAGRSPAETAYFLRQRYLEALRPDIRRLLRHSLPHLPETQRENLRETLRVIR